MGSAERRREIMKLLCRRRHETIENMAFEFGVSERTIRRDIEILSLSEPIYTQSGRYGGGVYVTENYSIDRLYMSEEEENILRKLKKWRRIMKNAFYPEPKCLFSTVLSTNTQNRSRGT